jgi:hypothetical protein
MNITHAVSRSVRQTTELVESGRNEPLSTWSKQVLSPIGSLQTAASLGKWMDSVAEVRQTPVTSMEMLPPTPGTFLKGQTRRAVARVTPVTEFTVDNLPQISFDPLQEWEGRVVEVKEDRFVANLVDITAHRRFEEEIAEFPIEDVADVDRPLLGPGRDISMADRLCPPILGN